MTWRAIQFDSKITWPDAEPGEIVDVVFDGPFIVKNGDTSQLSNNPLRARMEHRGLGVHIMREWAYDGIAAGRRDSACGRKFGAAGRRDSACGGNCWDGGRCLPKEVGPVCRLRCSLGGFRD